MKGFQRSRRLAGVAVTVGAVVSAVVGIPAVAQARTRPPTALVGVSWGSNLNGALGNGSGTSSSTYVDVSGLGNVRQISTGNSHSLVVTTDGTVYSWGYNGSGQLGTGDKNNYPSPQLVAGLSGITQVAAGWEWSLALRSDGTVWAWGSNANYQLGTTSFAATATPVQIAGLSRVTAIAAGAQFGMAVETRGTLTVLNAVATWGQNTDATLGNGTVCGLPPCGDPVPQVVTGLNVPDVEGIAAGNEFALVLGTDGSVWGWGDNAYGDLGDGGDNAQFVPAESIGPGSGITQIAAGALHGVALLSNGTVEDWGYDAYGQLGDGITSTESNTPVPVTGLTGVRQVSAGGNTSEGVQAIYGIFL